MQRGGDQSDSSENASGAITSNETMNPCPVVLQSSYNLITSIGMGFTIGTVVGSSFHFFKGFRNSVKGQRLISGINSVRYNSPRTAGLFALWLGVVDPVVDNVLNFSRKKNDNWSPIISAAATGVLYKIPRGVVPAFKMGLVFSVATGFITGLHFSLEKLLDSVDEQISYGRTHSDLLIMQPMLDGFGEWYRGFYGDGGGVAKVKEAVKRNPNSDLP